MNYYNGMHFKVKTGLLKGFKKGEGKDKKE